MVQNCYYQIPKLDTILSHFQDQSVLTIHVHKSHISVTLSFLPSLSEWSFCNKSHIPKILHAFLFSFLSAQCSSHRVVCHSTVATLNKSVTTQIPNN